jgi:hypothetical protein
LPNGGSIFAERPETDVPDARIIWHADLDPGTLRVTASPIAADDPDAIDPSTLSPWLTVAVDEQGEHAVLSDGWHRIRIDVAAGTMLGGGSVILHYELAGIASAGPKILPLRRLVDLCRTKRFSVSLYPQDRRIERWIVALRVHDAIVSGASQSDIAHVLFGDDPDDAGAGRRADSLRSRVRRLAAEAKRMAAGGYRSLLKRSG